MLAELGRRCLWPFALPVAFPQSLGGRDSTDYYGQSVPPFPGAPKCVTPAKETRRWFLGSCLVTDMGAGWLPNTFAPMERLRPGFFAVARARTSRSWNRFDWEQWLPSEQISWPARPRRPAATWSCLAFAINRLPLPMYFGTFASCGSVSRAQLAPVPWKLTNSA